MKPPNTRPPKPIVIARNRVPHITLIKRAEKPGALRDAVIFIAGASAAVFLALMALVIIKWHPFR